VQKESNKALAAALGGAGGARVVCGWLRWLWSVSKLVGSWGERAEPVMPACL